jgi:DNA-binding response OmpR family regulator
VNEGTDKIQAQRTMLIVDDQQSVRVTLEYLLDLDGYRVLTAESGLGAIALAEKEPIDGALIDINMPVMDGFATCVRLQALAATGGRRLRIWFMSGAYSGALRRRGLELGGLEVFSKPFDPSNLSKRLEEGFSAVAPPVPLAAVARFSDGEAEMDSQP